MAYGEKDAALVGRAALLNKPLVSGSVSDVAESAAYEPAENTDEGVIVVTIKPYVLKNLGSKDRA
jgi:hypothetical protein